MANLVCLALYLCANLLEDELSGNGHPAHASPTAPRLLRALGQPRLLRFLARPSVS